MRGDAVGIHYPAGASQGVIPYERDDIGPKTAGNQFLSLTLNILTPLPHGQFSTGQWDVVRMAETTEMLETGKTEHCHAVVGEIKENEKIN